MKDKGLEAFMKLHYEQRTMADMKALLAYCRYLESEEKGSGVNALDLVFVTAGGHNLIHKDLKCLIENPDVEYDVTMKKNTDEAKEV